MSDRAQEQARLVRPKVRRRTPFSENAATAFVYLFPFAALITLTPRAEVAGFNLLTAIWFLVLSVTPMLALLQLRTPHPVFLAMGPWLISLVLSLLLIEGAPHRFNLQFPLQLAMPWLLGLAVSSIRIPEHHIRRVVDVQLLAIPGLWLLVAGAFALGGFSPSGWRGHAVYCALASAIGLSYVFRNRTLACSSWLACVAFAAITGSRMATLTILVMGIIVAVFVSRWTLVITPVAAALLAVFALSIPQFRERMVNNPENARTITETLEAVQERGLRTSGRSVAWPLIFKKAMERPWLGHGAGEIIDYVPEVWPGMTHPHNGLLRIFYEQGLLGLTSFVVGFTIVTLRSFLGILQGNGLSQQCHTIAFLGFIGLALLAMTDNILLYSSRYGNHLLLFFGLALSLETAKQFEHSHPDQDHLKR